MELKLYNSLTNREENFKSSNDDKLVRVYSCGPTVYDYAHIGNYRSFLLSDLLHRILLMLGYQVKIVMNITDIDDKTIKNAIAQNKTLTEYTNLYTHAFFDDLKKLQVLPAYAYPKASEHIEEMLVMISKLVKTNYAYQSDDGSVYFRIDSFKDYGKLSNIKLNEQQAGASQRVAVDEYEREEVCDFALWKITNGKITNGKITNEKITNGKITNEKITNEKITNGQVNTEKDNTTPLSNCGTEWHSPFGVGRPGWHIECSAMCLKHLGKHIDIHTGGMDNKFPHHENEIAQSEAFYQASDNAATKNSKPYAKYWLHCAHLLSEGKKMSKSLGNFYTLKDLITNMKTPAQNDIHPLVIRYMLISTHYRKPYNFTLAGIDSTTKAWAKVNASIQEMHRLKKILSSTKDELNTTHRILVADKLNQFKKFLANDLNTSGALGCVFDVVNYLKDNSNAFSLNDAEDYLDFFCQVNDVLCVFEVKAKDDNQKDDNQYDQKKDNHSEAITPKARILLEKRQLARTEKNWQLADNLRNQLNKLGYHVIDTPTGQQIEPQ